MKKSCLLAFICGAWMVSIYTTGNAALAPNAVLAFDPGVPGDPNDSSVPPLWGSYFSMQVTPTTTIYTVLAPFNGIQLGIAQPAGGSHAGSPTGTENPSIDQPWVFFAHTGMHQTLSPITVSSDDGAGHVVLEFGAWGMTWNGVPMISLGGNPAFPADTGLASLMCSVDCGPGDSFTLDYQAHVYDIPGDGVSGLNEVPYALHMTGVISSVVTTEIDIKPGSNVNPVNPKSKGRVMVAILTTEHFDASTVDISALRFGPSAARPAHYVLKDINSDADWNLVLQFNTQDTGIACGDTEATLTGKTLQGVSFTGTDSIKTVGCK